MDIVIAQALVGNAVNPQAKIVYANYFWTNKKQDYLLKVGAFKTLQCSGDLETLTLSLQSFKCAPDSNPAADCQEKFILSSKVTFVDVSIPPENYEGNKLRRILYLPSNFLKPLISGSPTQAHAKASLLLPLSLVAVLSLVFF